MNRFKMDETISSRSYNSLSSSDSGLTLLKGDCLVRKLEEKEKDLKKKDEQIIDMQEQIIDLQDIIGKYKKQLFEIRRKQTVPNTSWVSNLVAENATLKEELMTKSHENMQLETQCKELQKVMKHRSEQLQDLEMKSQQWEIDKRSLLMDLQEQQAIWSNIYSKLAESERKEITETNESSDDHDSVSMYDLLCYVPASEKSIESLTDQENIEVSQNSLDTLMIRLHSQAIIVCKQVKKLIEENKELKNEKTELVELTEFMNFENKFTLEENAALIKCKEQCQEENNILLTKNNELKKICSGYANFAGKMFRKRQIAMNKLNDVNKRSKRIKKLAADEWKKRKSLANKHRNSQKQLAMRRRRITMEKQLTKRLGAKNLHLEMQMECLEEEVEEYQKKIECMEQTLKSSVLESMHLSEKIEEQTILQKQIGVLKDAVSKKDKGLLTAKLEKEKFKLGLITEKHTRTILEKRLKLATADRQQLQSLVEEALFTRKNLESELSRLKSILEDFQRPKLNCFQRLFRRRNQ